MLAFFALALALAGAAAFAYARYLHPTGTVMPGIYAVRHYNNGMPMVNFFILRAGEKYIAIDAGACNLQTESALRRLDIPAGDIVAVFDTHADSDHVGSLGLFYRAIIYTASAEGRAFPDMPRNIMLDGETVEIYGRRVQIFYTPGHTIDSACFLVDGRYLFVGDLLVHPGHARYDAELQVYHRERMLGMDGVRYVFTGHFGLFRGARFFRWWWR